MEAIKRKDSERLSAVPDSLAALALLDIKQVCSLVGMSSTAVRDRVREGSFPKPDLVDGPRFTRWKAETVQKWIVNKLDGKNRPGAAARNLKAADKAREKRKERKASQ